MPPTWRCVMTMTSMTTSLHMLYIIPGGLKIRRPLIQYAMLCALGVFWVPSLSNGNCSWIRDDCFFHAARSDIHAQFIVICTKFQCFLLLQHIFVFFISSYRSSLYLCNGNNYLLLFQWVIIYINQLYCQCIIKCQFIARMLIGMINSSAAFGRMHECLRCHHHYRHYFLCTELQSCQLCCIIICRKICRRCNVSRHRLYTVLRKCLRTIYLRLWRTIESQCCIDCRSWNEKCLPKKSYHVSQQTS